MTVPAGHGATYEDLLRLAENLVGEILDGELYASPRPAPRHAHATTVLSADINPAYGRGGGDPGGWWILIEPELHLGRDILVADIAGWRRERMPELPKTAWFELAPDWICEVISPSTGRIDRAKKLPIYARERAPYAWLVDPIQRTVEIMSLGGDIWSVLHVYSENDIMSAPPFEAIRIELSSVWGDA